MQWEGLHFLSLSHQVLSSPSLRIIWPLGGQNLRSIAPHDNALEYMHVYFCHQQLLIFTKKVAIDIPIAKLYKQVNQTLSNDQLILNPATATLCLRE